LNLKKYVDDYVSSRQSSWEKYFHLVEFVYDKNVHVLIGVSLFKVVYGMFNTNVLERFYDSSGNI
jgi:hypothetical protein